MVWAANGVFMLINPSLWYTAVAGVERTGLFNQHFIRDPDSSTNTEQYS